MHFLESIVTLKTEAVPFSETSERLALKCTNPLVALSRIR
jgi:hypothetical protein